MSFWRAQFIKSRHCPIEIPRTLNHTRASRGARDWPAYWKESVVEDAFSQDAEHSEAHFAEAWITLHEDTTLRKSHKIPQISLNFSPSAGEKPGERGMNKALF